MSEQSQRFETWAIVELLGHVTLAGFVRETEIGGGKLFQIDVPASKGAQKFTSFFGSASVYKMTPVDQATVTAICTRKAQQPFTSWEMQQAFSDMVAVHKDELRDQVRDELRRELEHKPAGEGLGDALRLDDPNDPDKYLDDDDDDIDDDRDIDDDDSSIRSML